MSKQGKHRKQQNGTTPHPPAGASASAWTIPVVTWGALAINWAPPAWDWSPLVIDWRPWGVNWPTLG